MDKKISEKIEIIKKINTDDSNFILKVFEAFEKKESEIEKQKLTTSIIINNENSKYNEKVINLDTLWAKPYLYTKMRIKLEGLIKKVIETDLSEILNKPHKFCNSAIFNDFSISLEKPEWQIDIVDFISSLYSNSNYIFVASTIDEETLFKEEQLKSAIKIINSSPSDRNSLIYDEICNYLKKDFISNNYCDFKNNKCVAQRHRQFYPINKKNGCCFTRIRTCPHLKAGNCSIECLPCRLFSCPYLSKRGISYSAKDFVLLKAFFTKKQRKHLIFDFYEPKEKILHKL